jgi:hypothetical protein
VPCDCGRRRSADEGAGNRGGSVPGGHEGDWNRGARMPSDSRRILAGADALYAAPSATLDRGARIPSISDGVHYSKLRERPSQAAGQLATTTPFIRDLSILATSSQWLD